MAKLSPNQLYTWEFETNDGVILKQFDEGGKEHPWTEVDKDKVVRISLCPTLPIMPKHTILINHIKGEKFVRRFARGFIKQSNNMKLSEYVHCIVTNKYRLWVFCDGKCVVTDKDHEIYI